MQHGVVLVVDDDVYLRETFCEVLEEEGYRVHCAAHGQEALDFMRSGASVCMVLLDLMMPVKDGWEFRDEQRRDEALARVPVVVLTACHDVDERLSDLRVLKKPVRLDELLGAVAELC